MDKARYLRGPAEDVLRSGKMVVPRRAAPGGQDDSRARPARPRRRRTPSRLPQLGRPAGARRGIRGGRASAAAAAARARRDPQVRALAKPREGHLRHARSRRAESSSPARLGSTTTARAATRSLAATATSGSTRSRCRELDAKASQATSKPCCASAASQSRSSGRTTPEHRIWQRERLDPRRA